MVFVFGVVIGLELGFLVDVVDKDIIVEDWFKLVEDVILFVVIIWLVRFNVVICIFFMVFVMLFDINGVDFKVVELEILLIVLVVGGNVFVCLVEVVNEDCVFVVFFEVMEVNVDLLGIIEFFIVCWFGWMVDCCKIVFFVVIFNIGILFVDCIVDVLLVFSFKDDVFVFGVGEEEFFVFFVVFVVFNEMFEVSWKVLVFDFCVVNGLELEFVMFVWNCS